MLPLEPKVARTPDNHTSVWDITSEVDCSIQRLHPDNPLGWRPDGAEECSKVQTISAHILHIWSGIADIESQILNCAVSYEFTTSRKKWSSLGAATVTNDAVQKSRRRW